MSSEFDIHYQALQASFPVVSVLSRDAKSMNINVEDTVNGYQLALVVSLSNQFPRQAPRFSLPYNRISIPVNPSTSSSASSSSGHRSLSVMEAFVRWDPTHPDLVEATRQGFRVSFLYWGKVVPPTVQMLTGALVNENPRVLQELISNPNKLELYAYQHPMASAMRSAGQDTLQEMENLVTENTNLHQQLDQQQSRVAALQAQLKSRVAELGGLERNGLFASLCTPEAMKLTLKKDVATMVEKSHQLARSALDIPSSNKRGLEDALELYRLNAKQIHLMKLKLAEYEKQLTVISQ